MDIENSELIRFVTKVRMAEPILNSDVRSLNNEIQQIASKYENQTLLPKSICAVLFDFGIEPRNIHHRYSDEQFAEILEVWEIACQNVREFLN